MFRFYLDWASGNPFMFRLESFWHVFIILWAFPSFWYNKVFQGSSGIFSTLALDSVIFPRRSDSFYLLKVFRIQVLGTGYAHYPWHAIASRPFPETELGSMCLTAYYLSIYKHRDIFLCLLKTMSSYQCLQFGFTTTGFFSSLCLNIF